MPLFRAFLLKFLLQLLEGQSVDDIGLFQPALARKADAEAEELRVLVAVAVGVDDAFHALGVRVRVARKSIDQFRHAAYAENVKRDQRLFPVCQPTAISTTSPPCN